jgi:HAD-superfamily hydrolase, subfamily IIB
MFQIKIYDPKDCFRMKTGFKVIALDIDGTLLTKQQKISALTWQAIKHTQKKGIKLILVTGRHHMMATSLHAQLELDTPIICANGAYIYDPNQKKITEGSPLNFEQKLQLIPLIEKYAFDVICYYTNGIGHQPQNRLIQKAKMYFDSKPEEVAPIFFEHYTIGHLLGFEDELWKMDLINSDPAAIDSFIAELSSEHSFEFHRTSKNGLEIMDYHNSKGSRLHSWVIKRGFDMSQVIAFGDNQNDISMLSQVGLGVAMGNATDEVKQSSHCLTKSNEEDGIALLLAEVLSLSL